MKTANLGLFCVFAMCTTSASWAALPKLGISKHPVSCKMEWSSATAYQPLIAEGKKTVQLVPSYKDASFYEQEIVKNEEKEDGPLWSGGVLVSEVDDKNVMVGIFLKNSVPDPFNANQKLARAQIVIPAVTKDFPGLNLSVRVPVKEEKHGSERDWIQVEFSCHSEK